MQDDKVNGELNEELKDDINKQNEISDENNPNKESKTDNIESIDDRINVLENEVNKYKELMLRKAAEFENYKRRTENDQLNLLKYAAESLIVKLLPTVDDLERSISHMTEETDVNKIKEGIQLIYNKFMKTLDDQGVKKIDAVGKPFDVDFHEALMQRPDESVQPHTVLDELETGYMYKDRVIRHAKVIVSEG